MSTKAGDLHLVDPSARRMFRLPRGNVPYADFLAAADESARARIDATFTRALDGATCDEEVAFGGRLVSLRAEMRGAVLIGTAMVRGRLSQP